MRNRRRFLALMLLMLLGLLTGCAPSPEQQFGDAVDRLYGTVQNGQYSNDAYGITLTLPKDWSVQEDTMKVQVAAAGKGLREEDLEARLGALEEIQMLNLLQAFRTPPEQTQDFNPSLVMMAERVEKTMGADAYLEASRAVMTQRQLPMGFEQQLDAPLKPVTIGGKEAQLLETVIDTSLFQIHQDYYAVPVQDRMVGLMLTWKTAEERDMLVEALGTLKIQ